MINRTKIRYALLTTGLISQIANGADQLFQFQSLPDLMSPSGLQRMESLNPNQRIQLRFRIHDFMNQYPSFQISKHQFLVDKMGVIYVIETQNSPADEDSIIAMPSCIEPGKDSTK